MKLYIAGPMRGLPRFNFPAFERATAALRAQGHDVVSPHEKDADVPGFDPADSSTIAALDMADTMRWCLRAVLDCDAIAMLAGWEFSDGARIERCVAESAGRLVFLCTDDYELVPAPAWDHPMVFAPGRRLA